MDFAKTAYAQQFLQKKAFAPYTPEAQAAGQPPQGAPADPSQGAPSATPQGQAPGQGQPPAPIQTVPGPDGQPMDPNTGCIVLDPVQGIEQDPLTGILINLSTGEFATPEGEALDPNQAQQMIAEARAQAQGAGGPPAQDPAAASAGAQGAVPSPAAMTTPDAGGAAAPAPQQAPSPQGQTFDPATGAMIDDATGMMVDPNTGALVDPNTGASVDPNTGNPMAPAPTDQAAFTDDPEIQKTIQEVLASNNAAEKALAGLKQGQLSLRNDVQGFRRDVQALEDKQDATLQHVDNLLAMIERTFGAPAPQKKI